MRGSQNKTKHHRGREMTPALIHALNHPIRRQILRQLDEQGIERSPSEMAEAAALSLPGLSFHARVLCELQVTRCTRTQPVRGSLEHFYASNVCDNELVEAILLKTKDDDGLLARGRA
jgi:DNA-binding transcriptional ArsR family regulator